MTFTEEQITELLDKAMKSPLSPESPAGIAVKHFRMRFEQLLTRPQPEFREGEVLLHQRNEFECTKVRADDAMKYLNYRKLRLSEMPEAVERLREKILKIQHDSHYPVTCAWARDVLADFDREIEL